MARTKETVPRPPTWYAQVRALPPLTKTIDKRFLDTTSGFADNESGAISWSIRPQRSCPDKGDTTNSGSISCQVRIADCSRWIELDFSTNVGYRYNSMPMADTAQQVEERLDKLDNLIDSLMKLRASYARAGDELANWAKEPFIASDGRYDEDC